HARLAAEYQRRVDARDEYEKGVPAKQDAWEKGVQTVLAQRKAHEEQLAAKQAAWEKQTANSAQWTVLEPTSMKSTRGATLTKQADGSVLVSGTHGGGAEKYEFVTTIKMAGVTGLRLEA